MHYCHIKLVWKFSSQVGYKLGHYRECKGADQPLVNTEKLFGAIVFACWTWLSYHSWKLDKLHIISVHDKELVRQFKF